MLKHRKIRILVFCIVILGGVVLALLSPRLSTPNLLASLGINLATAGLVAILFEAILRDELLDAVRGMLATTVKELGTGQNFGGSYLSAFRKADERIDIIALTFTLGINSYRDFLIRKLFNDRCHIRVLVLDPNSIMLDYRALDEPDKDPGRIRRKLEDTISACRQLELEFNERLKHHEVPKGSFALKTHRSIPYFGYSRMDRVSFVTLYAGDEYGISCPIVEVVEQGSRLFRSLETHFESLWRRDDSRLITDIGNSSFRN